MARTPLLRLLLKSMRAVRSANGDVGLAVARLENQRPDAYRLGRRHLLGAAAAGAAAIACGTDASSSGSNLDGAGRVIVIGGGIAGLHCAHRLAQVGVVAEVYEATTRMGGRMRTDRTTFGDGLHCEVGGELIDTGHATMLDLATELGIDLLDYSTDDAALSKMVGHFGGMRVTQAELTAAVAPVLPKVDEALMALRNADANISYKDDNGARALDAMSLAAWFDSAGVTGLARSLLEVAYVIEYGFEADKTNCLNFLSLVGTDPAKFEMFGESDELFHAKNGSETFIEKLAERVGPSQIRLGHKLVALKESASGRFAATFDTGATRVEVVAEHVVLAIPFSVLREVETDIAWPAPKAKAIREVGYGMNTKLMVGFSSKPWRTQGSDGGSYSDLGYQGTWDTSRLQPGAAGIITNFTGGARAIAVAAGRDETLRDEFVAQLEKMYPGVAAAKNGKVVRAPWPTNPFTKGSYSGYLVGQYTTIAGAEGERHKNVHFAGEHTSRSAQGFMDGGALTGAIAAAEIAADLGLTGKIPSLDASSKRVWERAIAAGADERVFA